MSLIVSFSWGQVNTEIKCFDVNELRVLAKSNQDRLRLEIRDSLNSIQLEALYVEKNYITNKYETCSLAVDTLYLQNTSLNLDNSKLTAKNKKINKQRFILILVIIVETSILLIL